MCKLLRTQWKGWMWGFITGISFAFCSLAVTVASARSIRIEEFTTTVWFFVIVGALVVLLQLIPAALLFFSFIGTVYKQDKKPEEVKEIVKEKV